MSAEVDRPVPDELLRLAVDVAHEAGELVVQRRRDGVRVAATKSTLTDVVTAADQESERLIRSRVAAARPGDAVLGEEQGTTSGTSGVTWIVDPIDGTVNYLYDIGTYAISIAAEVDGTVVAGVVHNPVSGETWTATLGGNAFLDGDPIAVSGQSELSQSLIATGFGYEPSMRRTQAEILVSVITEVRDIRRAGSAAIDLCQVAMGRCDGSYERGLNRWDVAAGLLIAMEAGARAGGPPGSPADRRLTVCATPAIFEPLQRLVAPLAAA